MALKSKSLSPKKVSILVIILIVSNSLAAYLVYNNFFKKEEAPTPAGQITITPISPEATSPLGAPPPRPTQTSAMPLITYPKGFTPLPEIPVLNFDLSFLNDPKFTNLIQHGDWPVAPGILGRENPFLPFPGLPTSTSFF